MKKTFKTVISFVLITLLVLSFSSCSIFESMRQNALNASMKTIYDTPEEEQIIAEFNELLAASLANATEVKENVSYSAGNPDVFKAGEEAGVLDAAAKQLKTFIMSANPGSTSTVIEAGAESLLNTLDEAAVLNFTFTRNIATETVTDEKGNNVTNENGENVTESKISDNILHLTFNYFDYVTVAEDATEETTVAVEETVAEEVVAEDTTTEAAAEETEAATEEATAEETTAEAETVVEETTLILADDATIESVFGTLKDKETVLKNFENIKDYIVVSDYEIAYENCLITSDADLEAGVLNFVNFQKNMKVTAKAEGVGALAEYGEIEIVFTLTLNTNYEFTYADASEEDETADAAEDTTADEAASVDAEETVAGEAATEAAVEEATAETEETTAEETTAEETTVA